MNASAWRATLLRDRTPPELGSMLPALPRIDTQSQMFGIQRNAP